MNTHPDQPRLQISSPASLLAVVPHLLGFAPASSLVVLGMVLPTGRVHLTVRYDLPDPPDAELAADIAAHAASVLTREHMTSVALIGYGPGPLVTPAVDAIREAAAGAA